MSKARRLLKAGCKVEVVVVVVVLVVLLPAGGLAPPPSHSRRLLLEVEDLLVVMVVDPRLVESSEGHIRRLLKAGNKTEVVDVVPPACGGLAPPPSQLRRLREFPGFGTMPSDGAGEPPGCGFCSAQRRLLPFSVGGPGKVPDLFGRIEISAQFRNSSPYRPARPQPASFMVAHGALHHMHQLLSGNGYCR
mmetsp:Transcript_26759/g.48588  ORF Transcript_26759/g.48588 Transcript_26759/m.48588 type:complete len:191 (+) Transcript_26759:1553-2125(+)